MRRRRQAAIDSSRRAESRSPLRKTALWPSRRTKDNPGNSGSPLAGAPGSCRAGTACGGVHVKGEPMRPTFILIVLGCGLCWGQAADDCKPSTLNVPGAKYPCVYSDNRVTFRVAAPDAQKVQVRLGRVYDMTRGADGMWSVTIPPQVVGFHYYTIIVDGVVVADPASK